MIAHRTPFFLPWLYPRLLWRVPDESKSIYLTFDDGPVPGPTEFVLEHLKPGMKATFFCIGDNIGKHPDIFSKVASSHSVGNHTFNHLNGWATHNDVYLDNVKKCDDVISAHGSKVPTLFRPPYGRVRRSQISLLNNYRVVMWDVLTHDYDRNQSPERCLRESIKASRSGSIVVFHDSVKAARNMEYSLPRFIDHFAGLGYSFKALS